MKNGCFNCIITFEISHCSNGTAFKINIRKRNSRIRNRLRNTPGNNGFLLRHDDIRKYEEKWNKEKLFELHPHATGIITYLPISFQVIQHFPHDVFGETYRPVELLLLYNHCPIIAN